MKLVVTSGVTHQNNYSMCEYQWWVGLFQVMLTFITPNHTCTHSHTCVKHSINIHKYGAVSRLGDGVDSKFSHFILIQCSFSQILVVHMVMRGQIWVQHQVKQTYHPPNIIQTSTYKVIEGPILVAWGCEMVMLD